MQSQTANWTITFLNGEKLEYKDVFKLYYRPLCYFADRIIKERTEAEDIVAESFIKLLRTELRTPTELSLKSFLFTTTRNACIDSLRKRKHAFTPVEDLPVSRADDNSAVEQEMVFAQVLQLIYAEIEQLPAQPRVVFKKFFFENKSSELIAEELGLSRQTVLNHKTRALNILKAALYRNGLPEFMIVVACVSILQGEKMC